jgi:hypothetical protein
MIYKLRFSNGEPTTIIVAKPISKKTPIEIGQ